MQGVRYNSLSFFCAFKPTTALILSFPPSSFGGFCWMLEAATVPWYSYKLLPTLSTPHQSFSCCYRQWTGLRFFFLSISMCTVLLGDVFDAAQATGRGHIPTAQYLTNMYQQQPTIWLLLWAGISNHEWIMVGYTTVFQPGVINGNTFSHDRKSNTK